MKRGALAIVFACLSVWGCGGSSADEVSEAQEGELGQLVEGPQGAAGESVQALYDLFQRDVIEKSDRWKRDPHAAAVALRENLPAVHEQIEALSTSGAAGNTRKSLLVVIDVVEDHLAKIKRTEFDGVAASVILAAANGFMHATAATRITKAADPGGRLAEKLSDTLGAASDVRRPAAAQVLAARLAAIRAEFEHTNPSGPDDAIALGVLRASIDYVESVLPLIRSENEVGNSVTSNFVASFTAGFVVGYRVSVPLRRTP